MRMMVGLPVVRGDDDAVRRRQEPAAEAGEVLGGFGTQQRADGEARRSGPRSSTGTKSMAYEVAKSVVPWLGTRSAGLFRVSQRPSNG